MTVEAVRAVPYREKSSFDYTRYLRNDKLPHIWCAGCGHGIVLKALLRAIDATGASKDSIAMISGIGCSSRTPGYVDFNTMHTLHGRALAYATGVKLANPRLKVIVTTGDGDALAIGGNHFIHACRRNMDMTILVYNNHIYGMTSGQSSPTTPQGMVSTTAKLGSLEPVFDICDMAKAAGATYVARGTAYHCKELEKIIFDAIAHKGTSVVDIIDSCPTYYGRMNQIKGVSELMEVAEKDATVPINQAARMTPEELKGKLVRGVLHTSERPEYCEQYDLFLKSAAAVAGGES